MNETLGSPGVQLPTRAQTAGGEERQGAHVRHIIEGILWVIGLAVLAWGAVTTKGHSGPYPGEVEFSRWVQALHPGAWFDVSLGFISGFNNPLPAAIGIVFWFFGMLIMRWYRQAWFFILTVIGGNLINIQIGNYVSRLRPSPSLIHVMDILKFNSFPSGHSEHVVAYSGALLYLSFTKPVRQWRHHLWLIPLQVFAVLNILGVGLARIQEGEHWLTDVLSGYLSGLLWLFLGIFIYRWVTNLLARRQAEREPQVAQAMAGPMERAK